MRRNIKIYQILFMLAILAFIAGCHSSRDKDGPPAGAADGIPRAEAVEENLEDMYIRIYGKEAVYFDGDLMKVDPGRGYGETVRLKGEKLEKHYEKLLKEAQTLEQEKKYIRAVRKLNHCSYIENRMFRKPGLGAIALERIRDEAYQRALQLQKKGKIYDALESAETSVISSPSNPDSLMLAGRLFAATGEEGLAIPFLKTALQYYPKDTKLKYELKNLYVLEGEPEKAIPLITEDISPHTRLGSYWADLAEARSVEFYMNPNKVGSKEKVNETLDKALSDRRISKLGRQEIYFSRELFNNNFEEALKTLKDMEQINTEPAMETRIIYLRGLLHLARGRREQGARFLKDTVRRNYDHLNITQGENYMGLMSAWALDVIGAERLTPRLAGAIFSRLKNPDHSYTQEFNYILNYLEARENSQWAKSAEALEKLMSKRHLEPVGDFVQDILQVPAEKGLVYISLGMMYERDQKPEKAVKFYKMAAKNAFFGFKARQHMKRFEQDGRF